MNCVFFFISQCLEHGAFPLSIYLYSLYNLPPSNILKTCKKFLDMAQEYSEWSHFWQIIWASSQYNFSKQHCPKSQLGRGEVDMKVPPLAKKILKIDSYRKRENRMILDISITFLSRPHAQQYPTSTNGAPYISRLSLRKRKNMKFCRQRGGWGPRSSGIKINNMTQEKYFEYSFIAMNGICNQIN